MKNKGLKLLLLAGALLLTGCRRNETSSLNSSNPSSNQTTSSSSQTSSGTISSIAVSKYGTFENPLTPAQVKTICDESTKDHSDEKGYVTGVINSNVSKNQHGGYEFYLEAGEISFQVYSAKLKDGVSEPKKGDTVIIYGYFKKYNDIYEVAYIQSLNDSPEIQSVVKGTDSGDQGDSNLPASGEVTIAQAIEIAMNAGSTETTGTYILRGTIKNIENSEWGNLYITDGTDEILIYGLLDSNGKKYGEMDKAPTTGDEIVVEGKLMAFNGSKPQMKNALLKSIEVTFDEADYTVKSVTEARNANTGLKVKVTGVVASITYADGMVKDGFYLVDNGNSIYVYGKDVAASVEKGNTVTVCGTKEYFISEKEASSAEKYGYKGCNQISNARVTENDKLLTGAWNNSWVETKTVKQIMDTSHSENVTTTIYKVTGLVNKVVPDSNDFVNYYINDLDGYTGSYVYTKNSGNDFSWLDQYDGKICDIYLSVINAKSTSSGCLWRFMPIAVEEKTDFTFDKANAAEFAYEYYLKGKIESTYPSVSDANVKLTNQTTNDVLGFTALYSYSSSNTDVISFESNTPGEVIMHTNGVGKATVTIEIEIFNGNKIQKQIEVEVKEPVSYDVISIANVIAAANETEVTVKGIVVSSLVNQTGFYLQDETGIIAVTGSSDEVSKLTPGDEVIVKGTKGVKHKNNSTTCTLAGQIDIYNAQILENHHGNHPYSTANFITGKTVNDLYNLSVTDSTNYTTSVYVVTGIIVFEDLQSGPYYKTKVAKLYNEDKTVGISLYCSGATQYSQFNPVEGQVATIEVAITNWNCKDYYTGCIVSATVGTTKIINTLNLAK